MATFSTQDYGALDMSLTETPGSTTTLLFRLGLAAAGGMFIRLASSLASAGPAAGSFPNVVIMMALGGIGLYALVATGLRRAPKYLHWLILAACVSDVIVQAVLWIQASNLPHLFVADSGLYTEFAGQLLRHGQNPYAWDYGGILEIFRKGFEASTPRLNGAPESNYPYPALPFLLITPFQMLGLPGVFSLSILAHVAALVLLFVTTPRQWQPVALLPIVVGTDFTALTMIGNLDIVWVLALIGMVAAWKHWRWRAIMFGLAISIKQSPVLLAPFLLVHLWRETSGRRLNHVGGFVFISSATFLLINAPFIVWNPTKWFRGYTEPLRDNLVMLSHGGLATLTQLGIVSLPKSYFLFATISILGLLALVYLRHYDVLRNALWALPGIFMWFSFRSLISYWVYWAFPMILLVCSHQPTVAAARRQIPWKPTALAVFTMLAALLTVGIVISPRSPLVQLRVQYPLFATNGRIDRLTVDVSNQSYAPLTPRFAVQSVATGMNPLPWTIESGPPILLPGEAAEYGITSNRSDTTFFAHEAVQLVVADAGGNYSLRGVLTINPDYTYRLPDAIPNPKFSVWETAQGSPLFWTIVGGGSAQPEATDRINAIRLVAVGEPDKRQYVALSSIILFPEAPFGIWLFPPSSDPTLAYGLEILTGERKMWILFGPQVYSGPKEEGTYVMNHFAPPEEWTYHQVDLRADFAAAGWELPPLRRAIVQGTYLDARPVEFRLLFIGQDPATNAAIFGPITQTQTRLLPRVLMEDAFDDPAGYYVRLAESYLNSRNPIQALESYERALDFAPGDKDILARIDDVKRQLIGDRP